MTIITNPVANPPLKGIYYTEAKIGVFYRKIDDVSNKDNIYLCVDEGCFFLINTDRGNNPVGLFDVSYFGKSRLEPIDYEVIFKPD